MLKHEMLHVWYVFRTHAALHVAVYSDCGLTRAGNFGNLEMEVERRGESEVDLGFVDVRPKY
jgi:hypothetical protein